MVIGIGVGIVVIGIGVGIGRRFHTFMFLFLGRLLCSLHLNVFNTGMPAYLVQQWPSTAGRVHSKETGTNWSNMTQLSPLML